MVDFVLQYHVVVVISIYVYVYTLLVVFILLLGGGVSFVLDTPCSAHTKVRLCTTVCNVLQYHYCIQYLEHKMGAPIENSHILWILGVK